MAWMHLKPKSVAPRGLSASGRPEMHTKTKQAHTLPLGYFMRTRNEHEHIRGFVNCKKSQDVMKDTGQGSPLAFSTRAHSMQHAM